MVVVSVEVDVSVNGVVGVLSTFKLKNNIFILNSRKLSLWISSKLCLPSVVPIVTIMFL